MPLENWTSLEWDEALATGESVLGSEARGGFTATREGDTITMTGIVTHVWDGPYDFTKPNDSLSELATQAAEGGGAKVYENRAAWQRHMTAVFRVEDGELLLDSVEWIDVDEEPAP